MNVKASAHIVTPTERAIVANALAQLTPFQREGCRIAYTQSTLSMGYQRAIQKETFLNVV
jgi:hypothetical protein